MSADNWTYCPKCNIDAENLKTNLDKSYGKISKEDYEELLALYHRAVSGLTDPTLREDYKIGIYDANEFFINYSASCSQCNFKKQFTLTEKAYDNVNP